ncbi:MAG: hypothetical protein AB7I50_10035 [Vicinamibacterales bacterium]
MLAAAIATGPMLLIALLGRTVPAPALTPSYVPALEPYREREVPFYDRYLDELRAVRARWVFIGDSMLGTRIDPRVLSELSNRAGVGMVMQAGSGSAWWYLALKNVVAASGVKPRYVFIFFRDENLTDPMFRATGTYRWSLDLVARAHEPELNSVFAANLAGPWFRVHDFVDRKLDVQRLGLWSERRLRELPLGWFAAPNEQAQFEARVNVAFDLDRLRPIPEADMQRAEDARLDFARDVERSVLPEMVRTSERHKLSLVFIRVQRRPTPDGPPQQSDAMTKYVADLKAWLEARGAKFYDDTGAKELTLDLYEDGDHIDRSKREFYTTWFRRRLAPLFE